MPAVPNPSNLRAAREQRRLDLEDVATFASVSPTRLQTFEAGTAQPSRKQLDRLAQTYGVASYVFFGEAVPSIPEAPVDYRSAVAAPATLTSRGLKSVLVTEKTSKFTHQLMSVLDVDVPDWTSEIKKKNSVEAQATALRGIFDKWLRSKHTKFAFTGNPAQKFLSSLRLFFESQGGVLSINDAPPDDYLGFFINPNHGVPSIFVNRRISSKKAQIFTLAHEYAHFVIGRTGVSNPFFVNNKIERYCNKFAAEFVAPMQDFDALVQRQDPALRKNVSALIELISSKTFLSKHAAAIRLVESGHINQRQLSMWEDEHTRFPSDEKQKEKDEQPLGGAMGVPHAKRVAEIGHFPIYLASLAVQRKYIDAFDVEAGLGLSLSLQEKAFALASRRVKIASSQ